MIKYELLYFMKNGESDPLDTVQEVKKALFAETAVEIDEKEIFHGQTFTNGDELIVVNTYENHEEDE
jgi:hypothetical protein